MSIYCATKHIGTPRGISDWLVPNTLAFDRSDLIRLIGHWDTLRGLSFLWWKPILFCRLLRILKCQCNRLIRARKEGHPIMSKAVHWLIAFAKLHWQIYPPNVWSRHRKRWDESKSKNTPISTCLISASVSVLRNTRKVLDLMAQANSRNLRVSQKDDTYWAVTVPLQVMLQ